MGESSLLRSTLSPTLNVAAKIQNMAKSNQILVGQKMYEKIHPDMQKRFTNVTEDADSSWQANQKNESQTYQMYRYNYE